MLGTHGDTWVGGGAGGFPYEKVGDAHRLAQGCKSRILVSLMMFRTK